MSKKEQLIKLINDLNIILDDKAMVLALIASDYYTKGIKEKEEDLIKASTDFANIKNEIDLLEKELSTL